MIARHSSFLPPSEALEFADGLWRPRHISEVSYPDEGNDGSFQIEENSYWFAHRGACIARAIHEHPPSGTVYDIGGGNGYVTKVILDNGFDAVLVEPGSGASNAIKRSVPNVIHSTLGDCAFRPGSLAAAGAFDVVEHIEDDLDFLKMLHAALEPGGRFYATIPAGQWLWSGDDIYAGHFRRYSPGSWSETLRQAGFEIEYATHLFSWLTVPLAFYRALPFHMSLGARRNHIKCDLEAARSDHRLPKMFANPVSLIHEWELGFIARRKSIPFGSSLLSVARRV